MMDANKRWLMAIILIGGTAVLGSYAWGILARPDAGQILWGGVPDIIRPLYTINMFLAATGYFFFTYFIFSRLESIETKPTGGLRSWVFHGLYAAILFPSALWLPLTLLASDQSSRALFWLVKIVLGIIAAASLGLLLVLRKIRPTQPTWGSRLAMVGGIFFCIQTVILDAIVWVAFYQ
jgi:hypothetical protein